MKKKKKKKIDYDKVIRRRFTGFFVVLFLFFSIILYKLGVVMVQDNNYYSRKLEALTYSTVSGASSPRGRIYDRHYRILVDNKSLKTITFQKPKKMSSTKMIEIAGIISPNIELDYSKLTDRSKREYFYVKEEKYCKSLATEKEKEKVSQRKMTSKELYELILKRIPEEKLEFSEEEKKIAYIYYRMNKGYAYEEKIIKSDASDQEYAYVSENSEILQGFNTKMDWERVYPYGESFKSILGTVSTSSQGLPAELKDYYLEKGYSLNDRVGLSYIEKEYEDYLHGIKAKYEVVNSHETKLIKEGSRGQDIVLTIDIELQQTIERILDAHIQAAKSEPNTEYYNHANVVIQDPNNGEIYAMVGRKLENGVMKDNTISILTQPITPGSVVKGASMLVGYNTGAVHIGERMLDECIKVAGVAEKCSSVDNLGVLDDIGALMYSSNVYQFKIAMRVNGQEYHRDMKMPFNQAAFDTYRNMYHSFGLGVKTEIDLPVESSGYTSKDKAAGNLLDFAMGQYETYTPMQLSQYISTIANGGERLKPHLLKEVHSSSDNEQIGELQEVVERKVLNTIDTRPEYMARVKEGFYAVMNSPGGYGVGFIRSDRRPAGKTGTSQSFIDTNNDGKIDTETISTSFIGYAPADHPKVSFMITSPDSSRPNPSHYYISLVNYYMTREITEEFFNRYGID